MNTLYIINNNVITPEWLKKLSDIPRVLYGKIDLANILF